MTYPSKTMLFGLLLALAILPCGVEAHAGVDADIERFDDYTRYSVTLPEALPDGHDVTVHLGRQDGDFRQAWAQVDTGHLAERVDVENLDVRDGRLRGEVRLWVALQRNKPIYEAVFELDVPVDGPEAEGQYTGGYSIRTESLIYETDEMVVQPEEVDLFTYGDQIEGKIEGQVQAPAVDSKPARFELTSGHLLQGDLSYTRYVVLRFDIDGDKLDNVEFVPRSPNGATWEADVEEVELAFEGDRLHGAITVDVSGGGSRTRDGRYTFDIDAEVSDNEVTGKFSNGRLGDEKIGGSGLSGFAEGLYAPEDERLYKLSLPRAIEARDGRNGLLGVNLRLAAGRIEEGVAMCPRFPERFDVDVDRLEIDGNRIEGTLPVHFTPDSPGIVRPEPFTVDYRIDAKVDGEGAMTGSYQCTFGPVQPVEGPATVRVRQAGELREAYALRDGFDWPAWNGPSGNFAATPSGHQLVDRLEDARLMWVSEYTPPARSQVTRYGESNNRRYLEKGPSGGGGSPVLADGRVYLHFFQPVPGPTLDSFVEQQVEKGNPVMPLMYATNGIDVVLCLDAATGETLWRKEIPGGRYWAMSGRRGSTKGFYTTNPTVAGGRLYFGTSADVDYCVDAETGETIWQRQMGPTMGRIVIGDVMVRGESDLTGYDARTGEPRWTVEQASSINALPLRWEHEGKPYIIVGNTSGEIRCIDPADGEILWTVTDAGHNAFTMSVRDDYLLANGKPEKSNPGELACYQLTTDGAERLWTVSGERISYRPLAAPAAAADGYAFIRNRNPSGLAVVELASGEVMNELPHNLGASGYVQWMDDHVMLQVDASHGPTPLLWYDASDPEQTRQIDGVWETDHFTTASYYPILISHAIADGRIFIRGARGIYCYDLRKP